MLLAGHLHAYRDCFSAADPTVGENNLSVVRDRCGIVRRDAKDCRSRVVGLNIVISNNRKIVGASG